jgi:hypothetical protein
MRITPALAPLAFALVALTAVTEAHAQYKNTSFGFDVAPWLLTKPSLIEDGDVLPVDERPVRLANGLRFGGETNFKMADDHWWFTGRVNAGLLRYAGGDRQGSPQEVFDYFAAERLGTLFAVQGSIGVRYVLLTDKFRPYIQGAMSFMHIFSFTTQADQTCVDAVICSEGGDSSNLEAYLPHNDIGGLHFQPGVEMVFTRDIAFHLFVDVQQWIVFNAKDNFGIVLGLGFVFFT